MVHVAILWHQHQPIYKDAQHPSPAGSYVYPWVRLHAIRDYYSMAALVAEHHDLHLTINLTPALLWQIEDYVERGATDRALELTLAPVEALGADEREQVLSTFFDADWHRQIFPHPRYKALFEQRQAGVPFTAQDVCDLQMWFSLAWFGAEFRSAQVPLVTGETVSIDRFVTQGQGFNTDDIRAMVAEQYKVLRAVIPIHRLLQDRGQIEVSTTPYYHPILPLLVDTDRATIDRPGAHYPPRFHHPDDADAQVERAVACYQRHFARMPRGMWPAEGAVSQSIVPIFARHGIHWIASDRGVLARSGRWGYNVDDPRVLCQPYRAEEGETALTVFFRDTPLSNAIGFDYQRYRSYTQAAQDFMRELEHRFVRTLPSETDYVLPVILDGENAWGAYPEDARPFLHALYSRLEQLERNEQVRTVTFAEYISGNSARGVAAHPIETQVKVYDLFTGSWIDESGSAPGVDLGTWIGEAEENRAWELLGQTRAALDALLEVQHASPESAPTAFEAIYMAEGSDWFWWFGDDQDSGHDEDFDDLFRTHLKNMYRAMGVEPPPALNQHIVSHSTLWTFAKPVHAIQPGDRMTVRTNCPGVLAWWTQGTEDGGVTRAEQQAQSAQQADLAPVGGMMAGLRRYHCTVGPFSLKARAIHFRFRCMHPVCDGTNICCRGEEHVVAIQPEAGGTESNPPTATFPTSVQDSMQASTG